MSDAAEKFVQKWSATALPERSASQEHFIDLCRLIAQPTPAEADPTGENYCFEKSVKVVAAASKGSKGEGGVTPIRNSTKFVTPPQFQGPGICVYSRWNAEGF